MDYYISNTTIAEMKGHAYAMKTKNRISAQILILLMTALWPIHVYPQSVAPAGRDISPRHLSFQYLGLTWHPGGGNTPEIYPLKFDKKAYLVLSVGAAVNLDYRLNNTFFFRFTASLYKDCAFLTSGCLHAGPRVQYSRGRNCLNVGIGPIFSFRGDWHRFKEYQDDEFYGNRIYKNWQYRFFATALELEYLRRINDSMEFQYSVIPGAPLVITFMFGVRFKLD
jgi:hypothetical protein